MKYCNYCGSQLDDDSKICNQCGATSSTVVEEKPNKVNSTNTNNYMLFNFNGVYVDLKSLIDKYPNDRIKAIKELRGITKLDLTSAKKVIDEAYLGRLYIPDTSKSNLKGNKGCLLVFAWIFLLPIMAVITIARSKKLGKKPKIVLIALICGFCFMIGFSINSGNKQLAEHTFNEIKIVVDNKDYINAQEQLNRYLKNYPNSKQSEEAKSILETIKPEADRLLAEKAKAEEKAAAEKAKADKIAKEKAAAEKAKADKAAKEKRIATLKSSLVIYKEGSGCSKPDSASGVDLHIKWTNKSAKEVKYAYFTVVPKNAVGDIVSCQVKGESEFRAKDTGPYKKGKGNDGSTYWESAWYNSTIKSVNIIQVTIEYMDGSTLTIDNDEIQYILS